MCILKKLTAIFTVFCTFWVTGCAVKSYNDSPLARANPYSILILPPVNNSVEVGATYTLLSVLSRPIAEQGYYVFPVAVIDTFLKENGLPTPQEMNTVPIDKLRKFIGADAVLYSTITNWGQKYQVISSTTVIEASLKLVDARTGSILWQAQVRGQDSSHDANAGIAGALVNALVTQVINSKIDRTRGMAKAAVDAKITSVRSGIFPGPYIKHFNREEALQEMSERK